MRYNFVLLSAVFWLVHGSPLVTYDEREPVDGGISVNTYGHIERAALDLDPFSSGNQIEKRIGKKKTTSSSGKKTTSAAKTATSTPQTTSSITEKTTSSATKETSPASTKSTLSSASSSSPAPTSGSQTATPTTLETSISSSSASQATAASTADSCPVKDPSSASAGRSVTLNYGTLSVPSDNTPNALDTWASNTVYPGNPREVKVDLEPQNDATTNVARSTSRFEKFDNTAFFMAVTGLWQCTSVVVTSHCGAYMAHFWQNVIDDPTYHSNPLYFDAGADAALKGNKDQQKEDQANYNHKQAAGKGPAWDTNVIPDQDFVSLAAHKDCLNTDNNVKAVVVAQGTSGQPANSDTSKKLAGIVAGIVGISQANVEIVTYTQTGSQKATAHDNSDGKVLLSYNPSTGAQGEEHAYQVRVKADNTLVFGDTWTNGNKSSQNCCCNCPKENMPTKTGPVTSATAQPGGNTGKNRNCCPCNIMK